MQIVGRPAVVRALVKAASFAGAAVECRRDLCSMRLALRVGAAEAEAATGGRRAVEAFSCGQANGISSSTWCSRSRQIGYKGSNKLRGLIHFGFDVPYRKHVMYLAYCRGRRHSQLKALPALWGRNKRCTATFQPTVGTLFPSGGSTRSERSRLSGTR